MTSKTVKQDKFSKFNGPSILMYSTHYCAKENTLSTLAFNIQFSLRHAVVLSFFAMCSPLFCM